MDYPLEELSQEQIKEVNKFNNDSKIQFEKTPCLNCNSEDKKVLFLNDRYGFNLTTVLCKKCGLIFSNPRMSKKSTDYFYKSDLYRRIYDSKINEEIEKYAENKFNIIFSLKEKKDLNLDNHYDQLFFDIINSLNLKYHSVCEIGAGAGWNLKPFKLIGKEVLGYEPSKLLSDFSTTKGINVVNGSIEDIEGQYDLVILKHVLEHFLDPIGELMKLKKHIKKYLFIEVPGCINKIPSIQHAHNVNFSLNTLNFILNKCGFKKIYFDYCRSTEFIFALFEKSDKQEKFEYNYSYEVNRVIKIYKKFCIKSYIRKILKKVHPNFEKIILNISKNIKWKK